MGCHYKKLGNEIHNSNAAPGEEEKKRKVFAVWSCKLVLRERSLNCEQGFLVCTPRGSLRFKCS